MSFATHDMLSGDIGNDSQEQYPDLNASRADWQTPSPYETKTRMSVSQQWPRDSFVSSNQGMVDYKNGLLFAEHVPSGPVSEQKTAEDLSTSFVFKDSATGQMNRVLQSCTSTPGNVPTVFGNNL